MIDAEGNSPSDYDDLAQAFAAHRSADGAVVEALRGRIAHVSGARVLEVGCGIGNYVIGLQERTGAWCCGVDPSRAMLALARARAARAAWIRGRAEALPFDADTFDLVFFVDVMHHVGDPARALAEAFRVTRPGGSVCVATEDEQGIRARLHSRYFPEVVAVELARYPPIGELRAAFEACGAVRVEQQHTKTRQRVTDIAPYRDRAFSSLHRIPEEAYRRGLERMRLDLERRVALEAVWTHLLLWGAKPAPA